MNLHLKAKLESQRAPLVASKRLSSSSAKGQRNWGLKNSWASKRSRSFQGRSAAPRSGLWLKKIKTEPWFWGWHWCPENLEFPDLIQSFGPTKRLEKKVKVLVVSVIVWLCDSVDRDLPGSSVHGILKARILVWVAIPFYRGLAPPRDWTLQADSLLSKPPGKPQLKDLFLPIKD